MRYHQTTVDCVVRRTATGRTDRKIIQAACTPLDNRAIMTSFAKGILAWEARSPSASSGRDRTKVCRSTGSSRPWLPMTLASSLILPEAAIVVIPSG